MTADIQIQPTRHTSFEVYRYQLVVNKTLQLSLDNKYQTAEAIREHKNEIFADIIGNKNFKFASTKSEVTSKLMFSQGDLSIYKLGVRRSLKVAKKDFTEDTIDNYPNVIIAVNNNPAVQKIAIQKNIKAFTKAHAASSIVEQSIDPKIKNYNLSFYIEPLFDKKEFWNLINRFKGRITQVAFDLISPNMANISKNLKLNLKEIYEDTNTHKTTLELNSDKDQYLEIKEESKFVNSLVEYSAEGAGNIAVKVAGYNKKFHTAQSITEFSIDEQLLKNNDWDALNDAFNEILI